MNMPHPLSPAEKTGIAAILAALVLALIDIRLAAIPLAGFLISCLVLILVNTQNRARA